jgi:hypothetical protein
LLQWTDVEVRLGFPIEEIDAVAKLIGARRRKKPCAARLASLYALRARRLVETQ